uniref:transmembrane protein 62 isoform X2 n=1 Tax=Podarcis muralis TaxID=64176 RepID=UPI0010A070E4|nr:transmembrane protein 62 isoform X2 [Podarcis muralis]
MTASWWKMLRLVAGLLAAALAALLVGWHSPSGPEQLRRQPRSFSPEPAPGAEANNLFWIIQVSDLHISKFQSPERASDFEKFCAETVPVIQPVLTLATGVACSRAKKLKLNPEKTEALLVGGSLDRMAGRLPALDGVTLPLKEQVI